MSTRLSGDFETTSVGNLGRMGAHKYARQPSTRIICFAYAIDEDDPEVWFPEREACPRRLLNAVEDGCEFHAWNAAFEFNIWNICGRVWGLPPLPVERFFCSMARAAYWGVPLRLEQAAVVVGTNVRKDEEGHQLMKRMMKPRSDKPLPDGTMRWWDREDEAKRIRLGEYCIQDVRTERAVVRRLKPLPTAERQLWLLDQKMNGRGLEVDLDAVQLMQRVVDSELRRLGRKIAKLTGGEIKSITQTRFLLQYLVNQGVRIDSLNKEWVTRTLKEEPLEPDHREILLAYQEGAKTSTAKLRSMREFLDEDGRVRGLVQFGGALRTLRWSGRGPQIQNYPRPVMKPRELKWAFSDIMRGADAETIALVHGQPMDIVSQCLRSCYVPAFGRAFAVCDYSAIEARVVAWLAGQDDVLIVFRSGRDIYVVTAAAVGSSNRLMGKILTLACGFGMGPKRFMATAAVFGVVITFEESQKNVYGWRDLNDRTRNLWYEVDRIVRMVIDEKVVDRWVAAGPRLAFRMGKPIGQFADCLLMLLPSGRWIVYRNASIDTIINDVDGLSEEEDVIRYDGLDYSKKWTRIRTWGGKLVENATQATARDLLADAMLKLDDGSDDINATIHDELIAEPPIARARDRLERMKHVMSTPPDWAQGLPLAAAGQVMMRYGKE